MGNIRVAEAAQYVGLSKSSLDKLRCFGGGSQYLKIGSAVVYATADLDTWLKTKRRASTWAANGNDRPAAQPTDHWLNNLRDVQFYKPAHERPQPAPPPDNRQLLEALRAA